MLRSRILVRMTSFLIVVRKEKEWAGIVDDGSSVRVLRIVRVVAGGVSRVVRQLPVVRSDDKSPAERDPQGAGPSGANKNWLYAISSVPLDRAGRRR